MPYIKQKDRFRLADTQIPHTAGELNYLITTTCIDYLNQADETHGMSYQIINDIMGALEGAKQEFYLRVAIPYEKSKIKENGDVF